ncbi:hypothetical protein CPB83DRAFT_603655 [Crepidotus variabilis]|uniref:Uncharacterized protein n=1 Tax=Crepidotus variabilis TaxID=179855 RepID=A0A9P6E8R2_9AGAR|nr:hypothetical protein CPB83DRAFT_603655 [Crepidotus variabilis]
MSLSQLPFSQASLPQTQPSGSQGLSARASRIFDAIVNSSSKSSTSTTTTTTSSSTRTTFTSSSRTTSTSTTTGARRTARSQALFDAIISSKSLAGSEPSSSPNQTSITSNSSFRFGSPLGRRAHEPSSSPVTSRCSSPDELDSFINPTRKAKEASPSPSTGDPSSSSNTMMFFSKPKFFVDFGNGTVDMNDEPGAGSVVEKSEEYSRVNQPPTSILLSKSPKLKRKRVPSPELSATWLAKRQGMLSSVLREETNVKKTTNLISMDDVIEILDSDDEDYIPPPPKRQKTTTQIRHTRTSIKKVETIIEKDVTVLEVPSSFVLSTCS